MDDQAFDERVERLRKVNAVIGELDEAIRVEAFRILRPYIDGQAAARVQIDAAGGDEGGDADSAEPIDSTNVETFVRSQDVAKPANAVKAIAAWWFSEYGSAPIGGSDVEGIAQEIGVTIPNRPDNTLRGMKSNGKDVFRPAARGTFTPTRPHGELFFQTEYQVTKGRKPPPPPEDS